MKASLLTAVALACAMLAGCDRGYTDADAGVAQTKFPGQVTAGGLTSGQVLARTNKPQTDATYAGGTPGIAGGSGGTTGGAALGGTVAETGEGPTRGVTDPSGGGGTSLGGKRPPGDYGEPPANAPQAGVTAVGAGTATNQEKSPPAVNAGAVTGLEGQQRQQGQQGQQGKPPAAPGTLTGDK